MRVRFGERQEAKLFEHAWNTWLANAVSRILATADVTSSQNAANCARSWKDLLKIIH